MSMHTVAPVPLRVRRVHYSSSFPPDAKQRDDRAPHIIQHQFGIVNHFMFVVVSKGNVIEPSGLFACRHKVSCTLCSSSRCSSRLFAGTVPYLYRFRIVIVPLCTSNLPTAVQTLLGGIASSRPHRRTDSTVRPTPGTTDVRYSYSWYEVPYWYEYLLHAGRRAGRQASRTHPERIPNASRTNPERIPSENEGSRIYM